MEEQFQFKMLEKRIPEEKFLLSQLKSLLIEIYSKKSGTLRVNQEDLEVHEVQRVLKELHYAHIEYTIEIFRKLKEEVFHVKAYLLTILYNSQNNERLYYEKEAQTFWTNV